jgi:hypothetical protein
MSKKQFYSDDELVTRLWDKEEIRDLMARHSYYMTNNWRREELNELWVRRYDNRKTASLGNNKGYYVGWEDISNYYVVQNEERRYAALKEYSDARDDVEYSSLNLGIGQMQTHTANTHLVELSDDGLTAQYLAIDSGQATFGHPNGTADEYYTSGTILADLIKEDGEWKIWHLKFQHDATCSAKGNGIVEEMRAPADENDATKGEAAPPPKLEPKYIGPDPIVEAFGEPTIPMDAYLPKFGWTFLPQQMPVPYDYFDSRRGFGPDGQQEYIVY